ncbi:hypothetical protein Tco_0809866 [Tanacetum coccineum]
MSRSQDDIPPPPPPSQTQTPAQQTPHTVSTIKLPILKKVEFDIWAMKMEHYLAHTDYPIWEVIQNGNGPVSITTDTQGQIKVLPPRTAEEILARERERKARTTLLMALPEDHLAKFHKMTDAKEMWEAIKSRFGGNDESKKMQKFQSLLSQLEIHGAGVSTEDANQKFLRSLPSAWSQVSLVMRTKPGVDSLSFDDLYNNLRVFESDVKGSTASSSSSQNVAFVSENTSSTNDVSTAYGVSNSSSHNSQHEQTSSYSLLANQSSCPQLDHEDLEQLDEFDLEEMDLKWQVAMISMRMKKFYKKTGRKLQFDAKEPYRTKGNQDSRRRDGWNSRNKGKENGRRFGNQEDSKALVTIDGEGVDWTSHSEEEEDYALMACNSSSSDTENSQMSANDKFRLGYGDHKYDGILSYENEVLQSVFMNKESDLANQPLYDRFVTAAGMHAVPPPMTGNYMPTGPDVEIDYSQFTYETPELVSEPVVNEPNVVCQPKFWSDAPIIEEYELDSDDYCVSKSIKEQEQPSFASNNGQVKTSRETIKNYFTYSKNPKVDKKGLGYGFATKACFVCGSLSHLIRDCDFHEKRMAKQAELKNRNRKDSTVLTRTGKIPVNTARTSGTNTVNTARHNFDRHAVPTNAARKVNTVKPIVNNARPKADFHKSVSPLRKSFIRTTTLRTNFSKQKVNTAERVLWENSLFLGFTTASNKKKRPLAPYPVILPASPANKSLQRPPIYMLSKRIFRYLKGKSKLGLWYPRVSSFDLEAYSDSDYARANLDRKSTTGGCQFLGRRLISWQCKKQTIMATSTTEAEYVAAANCCGQFWTSAKYKIINNVRRITAKVAGKPVSISEASIRSDLLFNDADRIDSLQIRLYLMLYSSWDKQLENVPVPLDHFPVNALTSKVFSFMVKKGKHFSGKVTPLFASMLVQLTEDEGGHSERPFEPQPTPSPPHPSEVNIEPQSNPSPRPSPTTAIPDSIPETSGRNHGSQSSSDRSLSGNEGDMTLQSVYDLCISLCSQVTDQAKQIKHLKAQIKKLKKKAKPVITHHKVWLKSVSLKERLAAKKSLNKKWMQKEHLSKQRRKTAKAEPSVHKDPAFDEFADDTVDNMESKNAQDEGMARSRVSEEKENVDDEVSTEDVLSTAQQQVSTDKEKVSTDRPNVSTDRPRVSTDKEEVSTDRQNEGTDAQTDEGTNTQTPQTTTTPFGDDETIAQVLLNMSQAKAVLREKEKGVEIKDVEDTERPRPTSTRSLLTLKPLLKIDPKDKGKKKIEEEDEFDSESDEEWEGEEERKRLAKEQATNDALIRNYDDIKARIEADRLLAEKFQEEEREQFIVEERAKFLHDTIVAQRKFLAQQRSEAIRNRPPTKNQLRNQMMTYLKHVGDFKHSDLKIKKFEEIQALYEKIKRSDEDFIAIGSAEDERIIKEMNEKGIDSLKDDSVKEKVKEKEGTKKRKSGHIKMIARKKPRSLKDVDSDKEHKRCLKNVIFENTIDTEVMENKSIVTELHKVSSPDKDYLVLYIANGSFRGFNYLIELLHILDRQDLFHIYELITKQYLEVTLEGYELILWGDLKVMMESTMEENDFKDFWEDQQKWEIFT